MLPDPTPTVYVIDAKIVGVVLTLIGVAVVPLIRWLAKVSAYAANEELKHLKSDIESAKAATARVSEEVKELESRVEKADNAIRALEGTAARFDERIEALKERVTESLERDNG